MSRAPTEMELRVAEAMFRAQSARDGSNWPTDERVPPPFIDVRLSQARAAIRAMYWPTDEMIIAEMECEAEFYRLPIGKSEDQPGPWQAAIDAASPPE